VKISGEACDAIEAQRIFPPPQEDPHPDRKHPDGFEVWLDDDAIDLLKINAMEGESISDVIVRLFARAGARGWPL
jgi:hypothetical protein